MFKAFSWEFFYSTLKICQKKSITCTGKYFRHERVKLQPGLVLPERLAAIDKVFFMNKNRMSWTRRVKFDILAAFSFLAEDSCYEQVTGVHSEKQQNGP